MLETEECDPYLSRGHPKGGRHGKATFPQPDGYFVNRFALSTTSIMWSDPRAAGNPRRGLGQCHIDSRGTARTFRCTDATDSADPSWSVQRRDKRNPFIDTVSDWMLYDSTGSNTLKR